MKLLETSTLPEDGKWKSCGKKSPRGKWRWTVPPHIPNWLGASKDVEEGSYCRFLRAFKNAFVQCFFFRLGLFLWNNLIGLVVTLMDSYGGTLMATWWWQIRLHDSASARYLAFFPVGRLSLSGNRDWSSTITEAALETETRVSCWVQLPCVTAFKEQEWDLGPKNPLVSFLFYVQCTTSIQTYPSNSKHIQSARHSDIPKSVRRAKKGHLGGGQTAGPLTWIR